jgi:hypothetical protein
MTTTLMFNQTFEPHNPPALAKEVNVRLPPGLVGNPTAFPQCTDAEFLTSFNDVNKCPDDTALGVAAVKIQVPGITEAATTEVVPLFNLTPNVGEPARFGFDVENFPVFLDTHVRSGEDYGVTVDAKDISESATLAGSRVTIWGVPDSPLHDNARGWSCLAEGSYRAIETALPECNHLGEQRSQPFLSMPTACDGTMPATVQVSSWREPTLLPAVAPAEVLPALVGCNQLPFEPSIEVEPDTGAASAATGVTVKVHLPQGASANSDGVTEADLRDTTVVLPEGVVLNPASADGLLSCSLGQIGLSEDAPAACPEAAKVGTVKITTPLLPKGQPLEGGVYLAAQSANPFGSLVALYVVAEDPVSGTLVKLAGEVALNPTTGQLVSTFRNTPQLPFEEFELSFFGGARAALATPAHCGTYTTEASFTPWSSEAGEEAVKSASNFDVNTGPGGGSCPGATLPFAPTVTAQATDIDAGGFTPFTTTIFREDGEQSIQSVSLRMPPGLSGILADVPLCPEAQANAGTCSAASLVGHTTVSVGVGEDPYTVNGGEVFLTEGYDDAPFGLSIVTPAVAGPFNLGKVVVRAKIEVDPRTAQLTVATNSSGPYAIPRILDGIPLQIKRVNVTIDRSGFTFDPTSCNPMTITGAISSAEGASVPVSIPFQVANCADLHFTPKLLVSTSAHTSKADGASLTTKLSYPTAPEGTQANIAKVKVDLPKQLPSRLTTLQKACLASVFEENPAGCPAESIVGHATVHTPLLPVPLTGPAYFVSHGGEAFPSLTIVLQGYGVTIDLVGTTLIKHGITSTTFESAPDVPFSTFELTLPEGRYSALAANGDLCASTLAMPTAFVAQNGAEIHESNPVEVQGCPDALAISSRSIKRRTVSLSVSVPAKGELTVTGKGLSKVAKSSNGRETLKLAVKTTRAGRLSTTLRLRFVPTKGKKLTKTLRLAFKS